MTRDSIPLAGGLPRVPRWFKLLTGGFQQSLEILTRINVCYATGGGLGITIGKGGIWGGALKSPTNERKSSVRGEVQNLGATATSGKMLRL